MSQGEGAATVTEEEEDDLLGREVEKAITGGVNITTHAISMPSTSTSTAEAPKAGDSHLTITIMDEQDVRLTDANNQTFFVGG